MIFCWQWDLIGNFEPCCLINKIINSLGPCYAIWHHRSGSMLGKVMVWHHQATSHYLIQYWIIICRALCLSPKDNGTGNANEGNHNNAFENYTSGIKDISSMTKESISKEDFQKHFRYYAVTTVHDHDGGAILGARTSAEKQWWLCLIQCNIHRTGSPSIDQYTSQLNRYNFSS